MSYLVDAGGGRAMGPNERALFQGSYFASPDQISEALLAVAAGRRYLDALNLVIADFKKAISAVWRDTSGAAAQSATVTLITALDEKATNLSNSVDALRVALQTVSTARDKYLSVPIPTTPPANAPTPPPEGITLDYIRAQTAYRDSWNAYQSALDAREQLMGAYFKDLQVGLVDAGRALATSLGLPIPEVADPTAPGSDHRPLRRRRQRLPPPVTTRGGGGHDRRGDGRDRHWDGRHRRLGRHQHGWDGHAAAAAASDPTAATSADDPPAGAATGSAGANHRCSRRPWSTRRQRCQPPVITPPEAWPVIPPSEVGTERRWGHCACGRVRWRVLVQRWGSRRRCRRRHRWRCRAGCRASPSSSRATARCCRLSPELQAPLGVAE
ncbi:MAG: hypothetical protein V9F04_00355 [Dermatophilaceae bacterium]